MKNIIIFIPFVLIGLSASWLYLNKAQFIKPAPLSAINPTPTTTPIPYSYALPPSEALTGSVLAFKGDVKWLSRTATQSAAFILPQAITQGESLVTGLDSRVKIDFASVATVEASQNTNLEFIQTLPAALVLRQNQGQADYSQNSSVPIDIRSNFLLLRLAAAHLTLTIHPTGAYTTGVVFTGSVTLAYNDLQQVSRASTVLAGNSFTLNNQTRRLVISSF